MDRLSDAMEYLINWCAEKKSFAKLEGCSSCWLDMWQRSTSQGVAGAFSLMVLRLGTEQCGKKGLEYQHPFQVTTQWPRFILVRPISSALYRFPSVRMGTRWLREMVKIQTVAPLRHNQFSFVLYRISLSIFCYTLSKILTNDNCMFSPVFLRIHTAYAK